MQTFLPWADTAASLACLDRQRLGKQRVEALQILRALRGITTGWRGHPATKMWTGHDHALIDYGLTACRVWKSRGYVDNLEPQFLELDLGGSPEMPWWFGQEDFHLSHRSNLVRKDPEYYRPFFGDVPDDLPYVWPSADPPIAA